MLVNQRLKKNLDKYWSDLADQGWRPAVHRKILTTIYPYHQKQLSDMLMFGDPVGEVKGISKLFESLC